MKTLTDPASLLEFIHENSEAFIDSAPVGYIFTRPDGSFVKCNQTFLDLIGYPKDQVLRGSKFRDFLTIGCKIYYETHYSPLLRMQGFLNEVTLDFLHRDQSIVPVLINSVAMKDPTGSPVLIASTLFNITDRRKYERELLSARKTAEQSSDLLKEERTIREKFVATLSHDLRSPITAIKISTQLIQRKIDDLETVRNQALRILKSVERADQMVQDLLDANRIHAGELIPLEMSDCDLGLEISDTLVDLIAIHGDRFEFRGLAHLKGYWNGASLRRLVENLCNNAIKYGSAQTPVVVSLESHEGDAIIGVHNWGNPIAPQDQKTLFDLYRRTDSAEKSKQRGWGLGLTLVRGVARVHGGSVTVESSAETGTQFTVRITKDARPKIGD